jgi:Amt family ammonium transporter
LAGFSQEAGLPAELPTTPDLKGHEISFVFNTLFFLLSGFVALLMVVGFTMLEAGAVKQEHLGAVLLKNLGGFAACSIVFYLFGYHMLYSGTEGGWHGSFKMWQPEAASTITPENFPNLFASGSDWFFQMVLASLPALIVSGILAVRIKPLAYLTFSVLLAGLIYPTAASWLWGGGWLSTTGFSDFAGATLIHSLAGWCALSATILLGARKGRFEAMKKVRPHRNIGYIAFGTLLIWIGWLGYSGGSLLAMDSAADAADVSNIIVNTHLAACGGLVTAYLIHLLVYRKHYHTAVVLSGAIGGLVSISAEPLLPSPSMALLIGSIGGVVVIMLSELLRTLKIDDVTGGIPAHLGCGIWGTLAVPLSNGDAKLIDQVIGMMSVAGYAISISLVLWLIIGFSLGLRIKNEHELIFYS